MRTLDVVGVRVLLDDDEFLRLPYARHGEREPFLVVIPKDGDRRLLDPTRWFYCGADSDLDFLE